MKSRARMIVDGAVAGVIGAFVIALWYLIFDVARGQPLGSVELLAGSLFQGFDHGAHPVSIVIPGLVLFHFFVFALIGIVAAAIFDVAEAEASFFPVMLVFVAALEVFCIMIVMLLGPSAGASLPWWKFTVGDLMATSAMLVFALERHPRLAGYLQGPWMGVVREGAMAGLIGAAVVAAWFLIYDAVQGRVFLTPALLGAAIFQGIFNPSQVVITVPLVLGYTALHVFAFILFGITIAVLVRATDVEPVFALGVLFLLAVFELFFVGVLAAFDQAALQALGFWMILASNVLSIAAMLSYFSHRHRGWLPRLRERWAGLQLRGA